MNAEGGRRRASGPAGRGLIYLDQASTGFAVTIQALSGTGARLRQPFPFAVPEKFRLVPSSSGAQPASELLCERISQTGDLIRVRFHHSSGSILP